jgi:hypothetical protein
MIKMKYLINNFKKKGFVVTDMLIWIIVFVVVLAVILILINQDENKIFLVFDMFRWR